MKKFILQFLKNQNARIKIWRFKYKSQKEVFTQIYRSNHWESSQNKSGPGSEYQQTKSLIPKINKLIIDLNIKSILDLPCGSFSWIQNVNLNDVNYIGADIVEEIIISNNTKYNQLINVQFECLDITSDFLPECDLMMVRDCFVHLSFANIFNAIKNIKQSNCTYLLTTTFPNHEENKDIITGNWRTINLNSPPFNFPLPLLIINEDCSEGNGEYKDKSMALYLIKDLP